MSTHKNVIEINGKLYDAKSGLLISGTAVKPQKGSSIDGVVRSSKTSYEPVIIKPAKAAATNHTAPAHQPKPISTIAPKPVKQRSTPSSIKHRMPQRSHTLMRRAVHKPHSTAVAPTAIKTHAHPTVSHTRITRAQAVTKNPFIRKFNDVGTHHVVKRSEPLAVKTAPVHHHATEHKALAQHHAPPIHHSPQHHAPAHQTKSEKLFNDALEKAVVEPKVKSKKHAKKARKVGSRALRWGSAGLAGFLLLGFVAYMNMPNLNMQLASARAGFAASMPNYLPSGYHVNGPISYKPGQVTISFNSNTDQRNYKLTQEVSQWNSESLQENFLATRNKQFETTQDAGRTIYLYDNGNATWVNGGVWYQIESNTLSTDQLVKIASSL